MNLQDRWLIPQQVYNPFVRIKLDKGADYQVEVTKIDDIGIWGHFMVTKHTKDIPISGSIYPAGLFTWGEIVELKVLQGTLNYNES